MIPVLLNSLSCTCVRRKITETEPGEVCGPDWHTYAKDSHSLSEVCQTEGCCAYVPAKSKFMPLFPDLHIMDQSHCVFDSAGQTMVDFVGAAESLDKDWAAVVQEINRRAGTAFVAGELAVANTRAKHTGKGPEVGKAKVQCDMAKYPHLDAESMRDIGLQYSMDAVKFGYLPLDA
jgi:hypothetical protein